jgi:hypothetical protein
MRQLRIQNRLQSKTTPQRVMMVQQPPLVSKTLVSKMATNTGTADSGEKAAPKAQKAGKKAAKKPAKKAAKAKTKKAATSDEGDTASAKAKRLSA